MIIKAKRNETNKPKAVKSTPAKRKAASKVKPPKKATDDATRVYHVAKREDGKWQVKFAGGEKAIKLFDNQMEAIVYVTKTKKVRCLFIIPKAKIKVELKLNKLAIKVYKVSLLIFFLFL